MNAVIAKSRADLRRRTLQSMVIALIILLSSGAATLALSLLVESDAPYDHAFAQAQGAHLTLTFDAAKVSTAALRRTAAAHGVTAAAGPWPEAFVPLTNGQDGKMGGRIVGRATPGGPIDRITIERGRWVLGPGEIVVSQRMADAARLSIGDYLTAGAAPSSASLLIVGIAASISRDTDAWAVPSQVVSLATPHSPLQYIMLYRVSPAATVADLRVAAQAIAARVPAGAIINSGNYLDVKLNADRLSAVMVPFLLAFSAFALLAAALIISNAITGVVIASYRDIGVMKAVGFTPAQVVMVLLGQILAPALAGSLIGIPLGTLASQPFLQDTAHALGLPAPFTAALPVDLLVLAAVGAVATLAAVLPCWRAGRLSAVTAMTMGSAPAASHGSGLAQALSDLPLPRPCSLGLSDSFARPVRSIMTIGAILVGVATIVFALSLHLSLGQVAGHLIRDKYVQIDVSRSPRIGDGQVIALLQADHHTARVVAESETEVIVPGIAQPIPFYAYRGASSWIGYALIAGRWFSGPGEVVAPTKLLRQINLSVGDTITPHISGQVVKLKITGEILDQTGDDLLLRGDWATLPSPDSRAGPDEYEVGLKAGADPRAYADHLQGASTELDVRLLERSDANTSFLLLNGVIGGLALVLIAIAVTGVFNTVILTTREKAHDVAILKAVGMAPVQVVAMVVASVSLLGLIAGLLGIPAGLVLHSQILHTMGQVATGTEMPPAFYDLINHAVLPLLALSGVAVAALGAWLPAQWAASSGVAEVLQSE